MADPLGGFDAALQLAPRGADRLLALLHRRGAASAAPPSPHLPHGGWLNLPLGGDHDAAGDGAAGVRGHVRFQLSTPAVDVPPGGATDRVRATVDLRARLQAERASAPAPEFVHGALSVTTAVRLARCGDETFVELALGDEGLEVDFVPADGSGADAADAALVASLARDALRRAVGPAQVRASGAALGELGVREVAFRTTRSGELAALSLLVRVAEGAGADPARADAVLVRPGEDVALGLGGALVTSAIEDAASAELAGVAVSGSRFLVDFEARVDAGSLEVVLQEGAVRVRVEGSGSLSPGGSFGFRVTQRVGARIRHGRPLLGLLGGPEVEITRGNPVLRVVLGLFRGRISDAIERALAARIGEVGRALEALVDDALASVLSRLSAAGLPLDAEVALERLALAPDVVALAGELELGPPPAPLVRFAERTPRPAGPAPVLLQVERELCGAESVVPGGTLQRLRWLQVRGDGSVRRRFEDEHRFLLRVPREHVVATAAARVGWPPAAWCLEVEGVQHGARGPVDVTRRACAVVVAVPSVDLPRDARLLVAVPDGAGGVLADVDPWGGLRGRALAGDRGRRGLLLVHLADEAGAAGAARVLRDAAERFPLVLPTVVCAAAPRGCRLPAAELGEVAFTHDPAGAWRARFRLERPGATVLVGPGGRELWRDAGPLAADALAKVLGAEAEASGPPRLPRSARPGVRVALGDVAPDLRLPCRGESDVAAATALRKLAGREAVLVFWTSASEASREEVRRRAAAAGGGGPLVVLVGDGEDDAAAERVAACGDGVVAVGDPAREVARRYGVSAWPTVVRVDGRGRVADVRVGLEAPPPA